MNLTDLSVLYEDNHLIAVHKPAGWLSQGDETGDTPIGEVVKEYIKVRYNKPGDVYLGSIHRLDRPVSGVLLFAKTSKALSRMNEQFKDRQIRKRYLAIVEKRPKELEATITHFLSKDQERNITSAFSRPRYKDSKSATLSYKLIGGLGDQHLLVVEPETGRSHQIRAQLAKIGCPIRGDLKYGARNRSSDNQIYLHAFQLEFDHPVKHEPVIVTAYPPNDQIWDLFEQAIITTL